MVASPLVSAIWIGRYEPIFVRFVALLAVGWSVNVLCNPAYVVDLGTGALRWVSVGCAVTAVLNAGAGLLAGELGGGTAVVATASGSLIVGYLIILIAYHRDAHESFRVLLPAESRTSLILSVSGALVLLPLLYSLASRGEIPPIMLASTVLAFAALLALLMWTHPIRRRLFQRIASGMPT